MFVNLIQYHIHTPADNCYKGPTNRGDFLEVLRMESKHSLTWARNFPIISLNKALFQCWLPDYYGYQDLDNVMGIEGLYGRLVKSTVY